MTVTFLGDVFLPEPFESEVRFDNYIPNLEYPITTSEDPAQNKVNLRAKESYLEETFGSKPAAVCLANNHIMDYGTDGFYDTIEFLEKEGIPYYGAGKTENSCNNPLLLEIDGTTLGLCGYVCESTSPILAGENQPGVVVPNIERIRKDIDAAAAAGAEFQVVSMHWGEEEKYLPKPDDISLAHKILDAGADLIVGHHAHRIQPYNKRSNGTVFYGLGNCVMPDISRPAYFTESGESKKIFEKKQYRWNRRSLAVTIDLPSHDINPVPIQFVNRRICEESIFFDHYQYISKIFNSPSYGLVFFVCNFLNEIELRIYRVVDEPSRFTAQNIRHFFESFVK